MRSWSIPAGRLFGVDVRIHLTFLFLLAFVWLTQSVVNGRLSFGRGIAVTGFVLLAVLVRESARLTASAAAGSQVKQLLLLPVGGVSISDPAAAPETGLPPGREALVATAGPATNLSLALLAGAVVAIYSPGSLWPPFVHGSDLLRSFFWINLFLGLMHLLPGYPLDGGRVLRALFAERMDFTRATRLAMTAGQAFSMLFILVGIWHPWLMMVGFFLFVATQLEERTLLFRAVLERVSIEDVMLTDFSTLSPADTLEDALQKTVHSLQDDFPVVRGSDMVGVISRKRIVDALRRGNAYVQSAMNAHYAIGGRGDSLATVFRKLTLSGDTLIPVVEEDRLVGIVTLQNLMHSMAVLAESRRLRWQHNE